MYYSVLCSLLKRKNIVGFLGFMDLRGMSVSKQTASDFPPVAAAFQIEPNQEIIITYKS